MSLIRDLTIPLIILLLTPLMTSIGSQISTGDWISWFNSVPLVVWILFVIGITMWIIIKIILKRLKQINEPYFFKKPNDHYVWHLIGEIEYNGIIWILKSSDNINPEKGYMFAVDPKCPKCKTLLECNRNFWGGMIFECIQCKYKKRVGNYYRESERTIILAKRNLEQKKEK